MKVGIELTFSNPVLERLKLKMSPEKKRDDEELIKTVKTDYLQKWEELVAKPHDDVPRPTKVADGTSSKVSPYGLNRVFHYAAGPDRPGWSGGHRNLGDPAARTILRAETVIP